MTKGENVIIDHADSNERSRKVRLSERRNQCHNFHYNTSIKSRLAPYDKSRRPVKSVLKTPTQPLDKEGMNLIRFTILNTI